MNIYPALGQFFKTRQEMADAGCMSKTRLWRCLNGKQPFTENEKRAIVRAILIKLNDEGKAKEYNETHVALENFDSYFKKGV